MKPTSYIRKLSLILRSKLLMRQHFLEPNLYLFNLEVTDLTKAKKILFYLNDPEFMHVGDHLFFLPLIKSFIDTHYEVDVFVSPLMIPFFRKLGIRVIAYPHSLKPYDLIISRFELIPLLSGEKTLLVHVSQNLKMPICSQLLSTFSRYFNKSFNSMVDYSCFDNPDIPTQLGLPEDRRFILFNCYLDSSSYLVTKRKKRELLSFLEREAERSGCDIVFLGTQTDKSTDKSDYSFHFFDLRGKTSVVDIFELVRSSRVSSYVGFDAFIMHATSLAGKKSFVKFRGRLTKRQSVMLEKYHVNLFSEDQFVTLI